MVDSTVESTDLVITAMIGCMSEMPYRTVARIESMMDTQCELEVVVVWTGKATVACQGMAECQGQG